MRWQGRDGFGRVVATTAVATVEMGTVAKMAVAAMALQQWAREARYSQ